MKTLDLSNDEFAVLREALEYRVEAIKSSMARLKLHPDASDLKQVVGLLNRLEAMTGKFPDDYEACAECGFDHTYEPVEAAQGHIY